MLLCIPKILKNESNSQPPTTLPSYEERCCVSQRYWKMKAIHNALFLFSVILKVVVYPKDTEKWKQFTTYYDRLFMDFMLLCIPKILKNESNSQLAEKERQTLLGCCVSQRYWKMKAIHN